MRSIKKLVAVTLVGALMFSAVGCNMIKKSDAAIQKTVVAKVKGEKFTLGEINNQLTGFYQQLEKKYGENYKQDEQAKKLIQDKRKEVLDGLVNDKVLQIKAKELNLEPSEEELNKEANEKFETLKKSLGDNFETAMKNEGFTEESLKEFLKNQILAEKSIDYIIKDVTVSNEDVEKYYNENKKAFTKEPGVKARHILFDKEEEAKAAKAKINSGTSFDKLFKEYIQNKAQNKKPIAEDLGFVAYDQQGFDKDFLEGLKGLKKGDVSNPVKSSFGYHLIEVQEIQAEAQVEPLNDELKAKIKDVLEKQKQNEAIKTTIEQWKKDLDVKIYDDKLNEGI